MLTFLAAQFLRSMNVLLGAQLMPGNRVQALANGDQFFPDMLKAIAGAQKHSLGLLSSQL
ncbi:MAG: hypothetical protein A3G81_14430 [Betaproteobacteria bacterium RIFCSPLOWO2_12_FULL_65_14]|nr:MAG: hypothetical protein A3G81_14430 [Betaproteobacteria bacterium RIFCSPLOWO2_12_FULL_65_14]